MTTPAIAAPVIPAPAAPGSAPRSAKEAAERFEAVFLQQMLKPMFAGLGQDPLFGGGHEGEMYRDFLVDALSRAIAKAGGIGIAGIIEGEIARLNDASAAHPNAIQAYRRASQSLEAASQKGGSA